MDGARPALERPARRVVIAAARALLLAALAAGGPRAALAPASPPAPAAAATAAAPAALRVRAPNGAWRDWWRADRAPARWAAADAGLAALVRWQAAAPGVEVGELALSGAGEAWRVRAVLVRVDPARQRLALDADVSDEGRVRPWSVDRAPAAAAVALNAGMFTEAGPWGWVVHEGRELQAPGAGPLSSALVAGADGSVRVVEADSLSALRAAAARGAVREAVQSYPTLLAGDGRVPDALRVAGVGEQAIDLAHRDARLAVGELRDGRLLVALTRFDALGARLGAVPFGLTVPETAALMGALGSRRAVMLDGGISAQLLVREAGGARRAWTGLRRVPLGIVVLPAGNAEHR